MAEAKTKKGAQRRAAILDAARQLFRERGFRATSLDDIGARAGVSGPAIYTYFEGKHDILSVLLEDAVTVWAETVERVLSEDNPPATTLEHLVDAAVELELRNGSLRRVPDEDVRMLSEDVRRRVARLDRVVTAEWVHLLCEVRPGLADEEARAAVLMFEGMLRAVSTMRTVVDRDRLATVMKEMTLGGWNALGASAHGRERAATA